MGLRRVVDRSRRHAIVVSARSRRGRCLFGSGVLRCRRGLRCCRRWFLGLDSGGWRRHRLVFGRWRRRWSLQPGRRQHHGLTGIDEIGIDEFCVAGPVGGDDLAPVGQDLRVAHLSSEVAFQSILGDGPEVVAALDDKGGEAISLRGCRGGTTGPWGGRLDGGVARQHEYPARVQGVVSRADRGAVGERASHVEVEDLVPPQAVAEGAFGDGPVAVVPLDGDGRMFGRWRGGRWVTGAGEGCRRATVRTRIRRFGDRLRCHFSYFGGDGDGSGLGDGAGGLHGRGHHEDPSDQAGGGDLEGGEHREVDCLAAPGDPNRF